MKFDKPSSKRSVFRTAMFFVSAIALVGAALMIGSNNVSANHPVLVEGNCDSPVPGTTLVAPGTCGDFDGDGRIGTAEDTDGADRIFGTLLAALGPGTGAAAGTGANFNGRLTIVTSGRFAEMLYIGQSGFGFPGGVANPGNVEIEAAPGVDANLDAILQGDPAGGNATRTTQIGIMVLYPASVTPTAIVSIRNLTIRNWATGINASLNSRVHIDRCRIENNLHTGVIAIDNSRVSVTNSQITANGRRQGIGASVTATGDGMRVQDNAQARISDTTFSHNLGAGIINTGVGSTVLFKVGSFFNGADFAGSLITAPNPNSAN